MTCVSLVRKVTAITCFFVACKMEAIQYSPQICIAWSMKVYTLYSILSFFIYSHYDQPRLSTVIHTPPNWKRNLLSHSWKRCFSRNECFLRLWASISTVLSLMITSLLSKVRCFTIQTHIQNSYSLSIAIGLPYFSELLKIVNSTYGKTYWLV